MRLETQLYGEKVDSSRDLDNYGNLFIFNIIYSTTMSVRNIVHKQPGFNMSGKSKFVRHVSGNRDMD